MLEISVLILVLQIGFNAALNYRGYNQNPLISPSHLLNYGQSRRLLGSNRYLPLPSRRIPTSEIDQSDSEDSSLEEISYRRLHPLQSLPYQRQNSLRYNTRTDNDVSLEMAPIGRMSPDNYADVYRPALSITSRADTNFRRPYLRNRPTNLRQAQNRKYFRKGDNDLSLEESDAMSPLDYTVDSLAAAHAGDDASYLRSVLSLIEQSNLRRNLNRKYHSNVDNDLSLEVSPVDRLNSDHDSANGLSSLRRSLDDTSFLESLLSGLDQSNYRRANLGSDKLLSNKLSLAENNANSNSLRSTQLNLKSPNNRRNNRNDNKIAINNVNKENYNRRNYDEASLELSSNNRLNPVADTSSNLSAFRGLKTPLRSRKPSNNSPNANKQSNRRDDGNLDLELLLNDRLSPDDDATNNISFLHLVNLDDLNLDSPQLRSRNQKLKNFRRDDDDDEEILTLSSNDRLSLDDADAATNLADLQSENLDEYNLVSPNLRNREPLNQKNSRRENDNARRELLSNDRLSAEEDTLSDLSILRLGSLDDLSVESPLLRSPSSLSQNNNLRRSEANNNNEGLELLFNDRPSLDDNTPDSLVPYRDLNLRSREPLKNSQNENLNYNRRDNNEVNFELLSNGRLNLNDNSASDLSVVGLPSLDNLNLRSREFSNSNANNEYTRRDDYGLGLDFPLVNKLNSDDDASVLLSTNLELPHLRSGIENQSDKQDTDILHLEFPWNNQLSPDDKDGSNISALRGLGSQLRSHEKTGNQQNVDPKDYDLYLEFPWNGKPAPDNDTKIPKLRSYRTENLDNEQSYLRNRNRNRYNNRRTYNDPNLRVLPLSLSNNEDASLLESLEDSQMDSKSYLRQSGRNLNENENLEFLSYAREGHKNNANTGDEDVSGIASLPLDRRPHARHRTQKDKPQNLNRRANTPLATTTVGPNSDSSEDVNNNGTYNDTIIFPAR